MNSRKEKGKTIKEHIIKDILHCGFDAIIEEIQEEHQETIQEWESRIQATQYENIALQAQRNVCQAQLQSYQDQLHDLLISRHVPCANDTSKDKTVMIKRKSNTSAEDEFHEYPYYIAKVQKRLIMTMV